MNTLQHVKFASEDTEVVPRKFWDWADEYDTANEYEHDATARESRHSDTKRNHTNNEQLQVNTSGAMHLSEPTLTFAPAGPDRRPKSSGHSSPGGKRGRRSITSVVSETDSGSVASLNTEARRDEELLSFLKNLRIRQDLARRYCEVMRDNGYDDVSAIEDAKEEELRDLGIKIGHARRMKRAVSPSVIDNIRATDRSGVDLKVALSHDILEQYEQERRKGQDTITNFSEDALRGMEIKCGGDVEGQHLKDAATSRNQGGAAMLSSDLSFDGSIDINDIYHAKRKIKKQAAKIRSLEAHLARVTTTNEKGARCTGKDGNRSKKAQVTSGSSKKLTATERLQAHRERKRQENRYKEKSGKWDRPSPLKEECLTKKVVENDDFVHRLASNPAERRRHDETSKKVDRAMTRFSTASSDGTKQGESENWCLDVSALSSEDANEFFSSVPAMKSRAGKDVVLAAQLKGNRNGLQDLIDGQNRNVAAHEEVSRADQLKMTTTEDWREDLEPTDVSSRLTPGCGNPEKRLGGECSGKSLSQTFDPTREVGICKSGDPCTRRPLPRCETCRSEHDCEEDVDNPGAFYCRRCWDEYEKSSSSLAGDAAGNVLDGEGDDFFPSESKEEEAKCGFSSVSRSAPKKDEALWVIHDNARLGDQLIFSGRKRMTCLLETRDPGNKNCVRIMTGNIDYSGDVTKSSLDGNSEIGSIAQGTECIRLRDVKGFLVNHDEVSTRLSKDKAIREFQLDPEISKSLTGNGATMSAKEFLRGCQGAVDVILDPQREPGGWYPQREAKQKSFRKIAPQFRSKGVGYIRLGDDMGNNGLAFLSGDSCKSFFSTAIPMLNEGRNANIPRPREKPARDSSKKRNSTQKTIMSKTNGSLVDVSNASDTLSSCDGSNSENDEDAVEILKQLQNEEIYGSMKWQDKANLMTRLGEAISSQNAQHACAGALSFIEDVVSSKNVNVHVLRSAITSVERIGRIMGKDLVAHVSWRTIMIEILKLLKSKQSGPTAKETLKKLHGHCYTLASSLAYVSQALGLGKTGNSTINRRGKRPGITTTAMSSKKAQTGSNGELIEWLAETTETERCMQLIEPIMDKTGLLALSKVFLSHVEHRDHRCRKSVLDGLLHTVLYGVQRLGLDVKVAQSMCSELRVTNSRGWTLLLKGVRQQLEEKSGGGKNRTSLSQAAVGR